MTIKETQQLLPILGAILGVVFPVAMFVIVRGIVKLNSDESDRNNLRHKTGGTCGCNRTK